MRSGLLSIPLFVVFKTSTNSNDQVKLLQHASLTISDLSTFIILIF